jgi:hypothetical protein
MSIVCHALNLASSVRRGMFAIQFHQWFGAVGSCEYSSRGCHRAAPNGAWLHPGYGLAIDMALPAELRRFLAL